jgi:polyhydroxybutyrate depolymerase
MPGLAGEGGSSGEDGAGQNPGGSAGAGGMTGGEAGVGSAGAPSEGEAVSPRPSAACGSGGLVPAFSLPNTLFSVPASYDGTTPVPVVVAFHAAGNPNTQLRGILGDTLDDDYIVLYPKSDGNGWSNQVDSPKVDAIFEALDAIACYDQNRVFATGHSSGAQFIVQRLCAGETRWRAVAPVASSVYCSAWEPIPALVIHGIGDVEREAYGLDDGDGLKDIVPYRTSNGCQETFTDVPVEGCTSGGVQVNPGCRDFEGCGEPTRWCQHDDPQYGTSHHGVPCFGARVIKDFFDSYR